MNEFETHPPQGASGGRAPASVEALTSPSSADRLEEDLRAANRARLHNTFHQSIIHGLKGPLNAVTLNLDLLERSLEEDDPHDPAARRLQVECVDRIRKALSEVGDSLTPAVTVPGLGPARAEAFDVTRLLQGILHAIRHEALVRNLSIDSDLPRESIEMTADRDRLRQAVLNLVMNAFEATPKEGRVRIALQHDGEWIRIRVEDEGPGIPLEVQEHLFETRVSGREGAAGIGLSVAHGIVDSLHGRIRIENQTGGGAVAEIELPSPDQRTLDADRPSR